MSSFNAMQLFITIKLRYNLTFASLLLIKYMLDSVFNVLGFMKNS